jgi:hypothetical protein
MINILFQTHQRRLDIRLLLVTQLGSSPPPIDLLKRRNHYHDHHLLPFGRARILFSA